MLGVIALAASTFLLSFGLSSRRGAEGAVVEAGASAYRGSISPRVPLPDFALHDQFGRPVRLEDFHCRPLLVAFVYALCPDVCPRTASIIAGALEQLGPEGESLNVIAITVQPETDTPERVIAFSRKFGLLDRWHYLIGSPEEVHPVLDAFGIAPEKHTAFAPAASASAGDGAAILAHFDPNDPYGSHSAFVFLADADLYHVVSWPQASMTTRDLVHDLRLLIRGVPSQQDAV